MSSTIEPLFETYDKQTLLDQCEINFPDDGLGGQSGTNFIIGQGSKNRCKRRKIQGLKMDKLNIHSNEEMKAQISDTSDILTTFDLAPPSMNDHTLMNWMKMGTCCEKLFSMPARSMPSKKLLAYFSCNLKTNQCDTEDDILSEKEIISDELPKHSYQSHTILNSQDLDVSEEQPVSLFCNSTNLLVLQRSPRIRTRFGQASKRMFEQKSFGKTQRKINEKPYQKTHFTNINLDETYISESYISENTYSSNENIRASNLANSDYKNLQPTEMMEEDDNQYEASHIFVNVYQIYIKFIK